MSREIQVSNAVESEEYVIGAALMYPQHWGKFAGLESEHFFRPFNARAWTEIARCMKNIGSVDPVLVAERLEQIDPNSMASVIGGWDGYFIDCIAKVANVVTVPAHVARIQDAARRRELVMLAERLRERAEGGIGDVRAQIRDLAPKLALFAPPIEGSVALALPAPKPTRDEHATDAGNAARFAAEEGPSLRFVPALNSWMVWNGHRWEKDERLAVVTLAKDSLKRWAIQDLSGQGEDYPNARFYLSCLSSAKIDAMLKLTRSERGIPKAPTDFDRDPFALNTPGGIVDLRTGEIRPCDPEEHHTQSTAIAPDFTRPPERWLQFEREIFAGDETLALYVRRLMGYSLSGDIRFQFVHLFWGDGSNGKNLYLDTIRWIMGGYATIAAPELFEEKAVSQHPTIIADLRGRRMVIGSETGDGTYLNEALIKRLTGEATLKARVMHGNPFEFERTFKPILMTNFKPIIRGSDYGIWRRIRLVPFNVTFLDPTNPEMAAQHEPPYMMLADHQLGDTLRAEAPAILALLIQACREAIQPGGFVAPLAVDAATQEYQAEMDRTTEWIEENTRRNGSFRSKFSDLYVDYCEWAEKKKAPKMGQNTFANQLSRRGFKADRSNGIRYRIGIGLLRDHPTFC